MSENSSESSEALSRLKHTQQSPTPNNEPAKVEVPARSPFSQDDKGTLRDKFNAWLDSFRGPTQEDIERALANTTDRIQARRKKPQDDRRAARFAADGARRRAGDVEEARPARAEEWDGQ